MTQPGQWEVVTLLCLSEEKRAERRRGHNQILETLDSAMPEATELVTSGADQLGYLAAVEKPGLLVGHKALSTLQPERFFPKAPCRKHGGMRRCLPPGQKRMACCLLETWWVSQLSVPRLQCRPTVCRTFTGAILDLPIWRVQYGLR
jgi:hypothetical protein